MSESSPMSREEFITRFKAHMLKLQGEKFGDGASIAEYAEMTAPSYWDEEYQRAEGPEASAESDISYWER